MILLTGASSLSKEELENKSKGAGILILNPKKINAQEELSLAQILAKNATKERRNLAKKEEVEFLLYLSAKTNIQSALKEYAFKNPKELLLVSLQKNKTKTQLSKEFKITESKPKFKKNATPNQIERISLSRL